jgi:hypothetical protein
VARSHIFRRPGAVRTRSSSACLLRSPGDTGPPFFSLIDPSDPDILNQYVVTAGTDGYEVLFSLAELDPTYGASTAINKVELVPYADTG